MPPRRASLSLCCLLAAACSGGAPGSSPPAGPEALSIAEIQGSGRESPYAGQSVTIAGVVTGDFQDNDDDTQSSLGGFYVQDPAGDGDPATSDGVFVYDGVDPPVDVAAGDSVRVSGTVGEHFGETQIRASGVRIVGSGNVEATPVYLPAATTVANSDGRPIADLERYEGMLVSLPQTLTVSGLHGLERYGELTLSEGGRLFQFTNQNRPGRAAYLEHRDRMAARSILLDDGHRGRDIRPMRYLAGGSSVRTGSVVAGTTGNLRFARGSGAAGLQAYRLMPTIEPRFEDRNPRPGPPQVPGALRIASFNVLNFFSTIDTGADVCGPARDSSCRGADSDDEYRRQLAKTVTALGTIDADIVGLIELENNASESLRVIVDALNSRGSARRYAFVDTGTIGLDTIKTGFLFDATTVSPHGRHALLDASVDARFNDGRNRPALAQTFRVAGNGALVTVIVNHFKSKGSDCDSDGDPNRGDGQGNCSGVRTAAAAALVDWIATDPTASDDPDVLIIGDFNAYLEEDPVAALEDGGFENLVPARQGGPGYSFVFDSQAGALDHAFASASLAPQVTAALEWHINADESPALDYNLPPSRDPSLFEAATPYRASDHDPIIIGLDPTD